MGNTGASTVVLDGKAFLEFENKRGGYLIQQSQSALLEPFLDLIVAVDDVELHGPEELELKKLHSHATAVLKQLHEDSITWAVGRVGEKPHRDITVLTFNTRTKQVMRKIIPLSCPETLQEGELVVLEPRIGITVEWLEVAEATSSFFQFHEIHPSSPFVIHGIDMEREILVSFSVNGEAQRRVPHKTEDLLTLLVSFKDKPIHFQLYNTETNTYRVIDVVPTLNSAYKGYLGASLVGGARVWSRFFNSNRIEELSVSKRMPLTTETDSDIEGPIVPSELMEDLLACDQATVPTEEPLEEASTPVVQSGEHFHLERNVTFDPKSSMLAVTIQKYPNLTFPAVQACQYRYFDELEGAVTYYRDITAPVLVKYVK